MAAQAPVFEHRVAHRSDRVLTVGDALPDFRLPALAATVGNPWEFDSTWVRGRWVALLYWPRQSCVHSTQDVAELAHLSPAFADRETQFVVACAALDAERGGRPQPRRFKSELPFPVVVDVAGALAGALGLDLTGGHATGRATFVADPSGLVRWMSVSALSALRNLHDAVDALASLRGAARPSVGSRPLIRACAWCSRLQDEAGWHAPESFIRRRTGAELTHGICGECLRQQSPS